jgi:two-component system, NarL family, sensor kinase
MSVEKRQVDRAVITDRLHRELTILNTIAQALNRSVDLDEALHTTLAQVANLFDLHTGWIWLINEETGDSYLAAAQDLPPALADDPSSMEGGCYCLDSYREGDLDGAANVSVITCTRLSGLMAGTAGLRYHASVPLYAHGKEIGVLNVASRDWRQLSPDDLRLLYTVGDMLGIAVERARLYEASAQLGALEERNRIAREIHDTLAQGLSAIALHLETADAFLAAQTNLERAQQAVQRALALTRGNLEDARRSVLDLRAAPLEGRTLAAALEALTQSATGQWGLQAEFSAVGGSHPLPVAVEAGIYRIAQEAINNVCTHAQARHLYVHLVATPERVSLTIEDDGCGFEQSSIGQDRYGILGMNERVRLLGGELHIESAPGEGATIEVDVPLGNRASPPDQRQA